MVKVHQKDRPEKAGDYTLGHIDLINHRGDIIDLKYIVVELNIYESIYKNAVTGSIVIADEGNQIARMAVQGLERREYHLKTPGVSYGKEDVNDASEETSEA